MFRWMVLAATGFCSLPQAAAAQTFPSRPMHIIVGFGAGGVGDVLARVVAAGISPRLGQSVVVENRPGASGQIAAMAVKTAAPDGYTLFTGSTLGFSPIFLKDNPVDATKEFSPISVTAFGDWFVYAPASLNIGSLKDLAAHAKKDPGNLRFASPSPVNTMLMAALAKSLGFELGNVPYKTTDQTIQAVLAGDAQVTLNAASGFEGFVSARKIRPIAVLGPHRSPIMPDVATAGEQGVPLSLRFLHGLWTTRGTPRDAINKLSNTVVQAVADPAAAEKIRSIALSPGGSTPEELLQITEAQNKIYADAAVLIGYKPE